MHRTKTHLPTNQELPPNNPRRVLMTADTVGGVWHYSLDLCQMLANHGVEVLLATMGAPLSTAQQQAADSLNNTTVVQSEFKLEWMDDPWTDVDRAGEWLLALEAQWRPHLIHLNNFAHGALPWRAPVLMVAHSCVYSWWHAVHNGPPPPRYAEYHRRVERGLQAADVVAAPTAAMRDALHNHYANIANSVVIPNGRPLDAFAPRAKQPYIFTAGRLWDEAKNIATLANTADTLHWPLYIAGAARSPEQNGGQFAAVDSERVHLLGQLDHTQMRERMGEASIYCLPARYEPFGLSVLEAALSGCALVLGDIPSLRENWDGAALFVPPEDGAGLADALNRLAANPQLRTRLAGEAQRRAARFSDKRMGAGYLIAYHALTAAPAAGILPHTVQRNTSAGDGYRRETVRDGSHAPMHERVSS